MDIWLFAFVSVYRVVVCATCMLVTFFYFKQKTSYEMRISDWSSDVCSSDLHPERARAGELGGGGHPLRDGEPDQDATEDLEAGGDFRHDEHPDEIGRASWRERV